MCGISFILSGVQMVTSSSNFVNGLQDSSSLSSVQEKKWVSAIPYPTIDDLKEVISRRGPDHVRLEKVHLNIVTTHCHEYREGKQPIEKEENCYLSDEISHRNFEMGERDSTFAQTSCDTQNLCACGEMTKIESNCEERVKRLSACLCDMSQVTSNCIIANFVEEVSGQSTDAFQENVFAELQFLGATLQLRGVHPMFQPLRDSSMNVLVYNGEIFGGISVGKEENDTKVLMDALQMCCSCPCHASGRDCCCSGQENHISVPQLLSKIQGPWTLIYWQAKSKIVWFGRDAFGRRSLLVHWPSLDDSRLLLSSVAPFQTDDKRSLGRSEYGDAKYKSPGDHIQEKAADAMNDLEYWEELGCGICSISLETAQGFGHNGKDSSLIFVGKLEKHDWSNPLLKKLVEWERYFVEPESNYNFMHKFRDCQLGRNAIRSKYTGLTSSGSQRNAVRLDYQEFGNLEQTKCRMAKEDNREKEKLTCKVASNKPSDDKALESEAIQLSEETTGSLKIESDFDQGLDTCSVQRVLFALKQAVMRRTCQSRIDQSMEGGEMTDKYTPIAVLFSGGLDSMILAALLDQCLDLNCEIDLLNVSFDGLSAPDRISAKMGVKELQRIAPLRRWRLVEIDADPSTLQPKTKYLTSIIHPTKTYMDLNIGIALWLAACGDGWVEEEGHLQRDMDYNFSDSYPLYGGHKAFKRTKYRSEARILLVGSGADEQCAGYGRHRTKFRQGGWSALQEEMKIDVQRIWKRNLGRDDRCIADRGKEARFPFLDEDVIETLLELPLWEIANLKEPAGKGDKKILREVARRLGLEVASTTPKRAIQFGSRIARESNRRNFGSNRAANIASAGSAVIHCLKE